MTTIVEETVERERTPLRHLHDTRMSVQKLRIGLGNRVSALTRGVDEADQPVPEIYTRLGQMAHNMEEEIDGAIASELNNWPVYGAWLSHVRGIGPSLSGQMLAMLLPPIPEKGPSSWFKAAGLTPEVRRICEEVVVPAPDGYHCPIHVDNVIDVEGAICGIVLESRLPRARAGEGKITYHPGLRRCLYNVATSLVRSGRYYRDVYDRGKRQLAELHSGDSQWPPHRLDSAARWRMIKLFLSHLWEAWSDVEGIERRLPYVVERLGHQYIPRPLPESKEKI